MKPRNDFVSVVISLVTSLVLLNFWIFINLFIIIINHYNNDSKLSLWYPVSNVIIVPNLIIDIPFLVFFFFFF